jgi:hypothetical protein
VFLVGCLAWVGEQIIPMNASSALTLSGSAEPPFSILRFARGATHFKHVLIIAHSDVSMVVGGKA